MLGVLTLTAGTFVIVVTALSLLHSKMWWIRACDFPRLQLGVLGVAALAGGWLNAGPLEGWVRAVFLGALGIAVAWQLLLVWRYSPLAPREVQNSRSTDTKRRVSICISNVLQTNRESDLLLQVVRAAQPDVLLFLEADDWWQGRLDALKETHPHVMQCASSNTYGMLLYSRLPFEHTAVNFLIQPDIPSFEARLRLECGQPVWLHCVHPRPPAPGESDESLERDAELLMVGKRVADATLPVVVCGDLNDVAWSRTTRLFQKVSRLVEPRKGRGMFSTFHARLPGLRFPLDHIFHSSCFRLVTMRRLAYVGSDHFPVLATLSFEPSADLEQEAPQADAADQHEADATIAEEKS